MDNQIVLIGGSEGGIWRSTDAGQNFTPVSDDQLDLSVGSIAFSSSQPSLAYAGMGGDFLATGVLKSTDSGLTWKRVSDRTLPSPGFISKIAVDPNDSRRVYLTQRSAQGVDGNLHSGAFYVSTDGGVTWNPTFQGPVEELAIHPANPRILYLSTTIIDEPPTPKTGVYKSTDAGISWTKVLSGRFDPDDRLGLRIAVTPAQPDSVFALIIQPAGPDSSVRLMASTDAGATWSDRGPGVEDAVGTYLVADPANADTLYTGGTHFYKSSDGGRSWTDIAGGNIHVDQHASAFTPSDPNILYLGCDGGLYETSDAGRSYQSLNATLSLTQFYNLVLDPGDAQRSYGGTQDEGTERRISGSNAWAFATGGDGGYCVIDPLDPSIIFTTYPLGGVNRLKNYGTVYDAFVGGPSTWGEPEPGQRIAFIAPLASNHRDASLYFGTWRLFVSTDLGNTWSAPAGATDLTRGVTDAGADVLSAIGVGPADPGVIYTGSAQGRAMVSSNGGKVWIDVTTGLPDRFITSIDVDAGNSAIAYLTLSGYRSGHVFKTDNQGATWTDISGNLPDTPANALLVDPLNPRTLYAGTDIGIFRSTVGGNVWETFNNGLPPVIVMAFAAQPTGLIQAATHGRGAYELVASIPDGGDFSIDLSPASTTIPAGSTATLTIAVTGVNGFALPVSLTANLSPPDSSASLALSSAIVSPSNTGALTITTSTNTPTAAYTVLTTGRAAGLSHTATATLAVTDGPVISHAAVDSRKTLRVDGSRFGPAPRLLVNNMDDTGFIRGSTDSAIRAKGRISALGLTTGANSLVVVDGNGNRSNVFTLRL
jgi:photosystem II stability/assembly factor-like uncharacterized protein